MTKTKDGAPPCMFCGKPVDRDRSHVQNASTGQYAHLTCFVEHVPQARAILERAKQVVVEELDGVTTSRVVH